MIQCSARKKRFSASTTAGRDWLEYTAKDNAYSYVEARDLKLDRRLTHTGQFVLPLSHYHGITIAFDLAEAAQSVSGAIKGFAVDLCGLQKVLSGDLSCCTAQSGISGSYF